MSPRDTITSSGASRAARYPTTCGDAPLGLGHPTLVTTAALCGSPGSLSILLDSCSRHQQAYSTVTGLFHSNRPPLYPSRQLLILVQYRRPTAQAGCCNLMFLKWLLLQADAATGAAATGCYKLLQTATGCYKLLQAATGCYRSTLNLRPISST